MYLHRYPGQCEFVSACFAAARRNTDAAETEELIQAIDAAGILAEAQEQGARLINQSREEMCGTLPDNFPLCGESLKLLAGLPDLIQ